MDDVDTWVEQASTRLAQQVESAQQHAAAAAKLAHDMERVKGEARSQRADIKVTTDVSGRVTDIEVTDAAAPYYGAYLSQMLLQTINEARADAARQAKDLARAAFGEDSPTYARITADLNDAQKKRTHQ